MMLAETDWQDWKKIEGKTNKYADWERYKNQKLYININIVHKYTMV